MKYLEKISLKLSGFSFILILMLTSSCKKFLEIDSPQNKILSDKVFENNETATSAMVGIYSNMAGKSFGFASGDRGAISCIAGLSADEFRSYTATLDGFYQNEIATSDSQIGLIWAEMYNYIYTANAIIEGLDASTGVSEGIKLQLKGESKFVRAFCYFYLTNLFGDVPLILTTDYRVNDQAPRTNKTSIYEQIIADLQDAENLLPSDYVNLERVRPTKWAAKAFLARVYLYTEKWGDAELKATEVINQKGLYSLCLDYDQIFLKNSTEAIWQLPAQPGRNTNEGATFILIATPTVVAVTPGLINAFTEPADVRKTKCLKQFVNTSGTFTYPFKYKVRTVSNVTLPATEYSMVLRLAELYLIRAEAKIHGNTATSIASGIADLNIVRRRPSSTGVASNPIPEISLNLSQSDALSAVEKERRLELFSEWGHRWFDLKRTGRASAVLGPLKGATWKDTDVLYPLPDNEVNRNNGLTQNPGY